MVPDREEDIRPRFHRYIYNHPLTQPSKAFQLKIAFKVKVHGLLKLVVFYGLA